MLLLCVNIAVVGAPIAPIHEKLRHSRDHAEKLINHAHEHLHQEHSNRKLMYPHDRNLSQPVRGAMTHHKMVMHMFEELGVLPLPEVQEYALDFQKERRLANGHAEYETNIEGTQLAKLTKHNTRPI